MQNAFVLGTSISIFGPPSGIEAIVNYIGAVSVSTNSNNVSKRLQFYVYIHIYLCLWLSLYYMVTRRIASVYLFLGLELDQMIRDNVPDNNYIFT